jgi:hypothetical protein
MNPPMVAFEWLTVAYFIGLALAAPWSRVPWRRRAGVSAGSIAVAALVSVIGSGDLFALRTWLPHAYLVAAYWLPALLVESPVKATRFERWLRRTDSAIRPRLPTLPHRVVHVVELAYLACYLMVPTSLTIVWTSGSLDDVSRFWTAVLASAYACYGSLPWLVSRPPRVAADRPHSSRDVAAWNVFLLERVSHRLNTFPSGHVSVACSAAFMVATVVPAAGVALGVVAFAIAVGAGAGRYHYVVDVMLGIVVGGAAAGL